MINNSEAICDPRPGLKDLLWLSGEFHHFICTLRKISVCVLLGGFFPQSRNVILDHILSLISVKVHVCYRLVSHGGRTWASNHCGVSGALLKDSSLSQKPSLSTVVHSAPYSKLRQNMSLKFVFQPLPSYSQQYIQFKAITDCVQLSSFGRPSELKAYFNTDKQTAKDAECLEASVHLSLL